MKMMSDMSQMFTDAMSQHAQNEEDDDDVPMQAGSAIMPESVPNQDFDMDMMDSQPPQQQPASTLSFADQFNMNVNVNKMMDENRLNADSGLMNGPSPSKMGSRQLIALEPERPSGPDAMQQLSGMSGSTLDLMDEQQLVEEKDEADGMDLPQSTVASGMEMPEAIKDYNLVNEMEKNVKVTQIPDHTV